VNQFLTYVVPGIADGAIYALCALGLVLTYKTSGVFNFAHGAVAAAAAYAFYDFRIKQGLPWPIAALLALLLIGVIGGLILERLANWLSAAPTVTVVVATVGVLVFLQSLCTAIYGAADIQFAQFLPTSGFHVGKVLVTGGDMIITGLSLGSAVALFYFFGRTRTGKAMTAVVDDPNLLSLQATNPAAVRRFAWVLGSSFAAISGMLLAPTLGVSVNTLILLVIAAYGAAAIGLFDNLPLTVLGGLLIGIAVDYVPSFTDSSHYQTIRLLPRNIPFLVLFAVLVFVPVRKFQQRGVRNARRFRPIRTFSPQVAGAIMATGALGLVVLPNVINQARIVQYSSALGYVIMFASLGLITWTSGQISLCHLGFAAIGATTAGHLLAHGTPWFLAVLVGGLVTVPAGAVVAIPAIRLSGIYVAVATFGFGIVLQQLVYPSPWMFGVLNRVEVPRPHVLGIDFTSDKGYYYLALLVTGISCALVLLVRRSRLGQLLRALSDSPDALDAHGANTTVTRVLVFCIAAFLAGIGGAVLAGVPESASGSAGGTFDFTVSLVFVAVLGFCGRRPLLGPFLAAFFYQVVKIYPGFNDPTAIKYQGVLFGLLAIGVAVAPGLNLSVRGMGKRARERDGGGPVAERFEAEPAKAIQPVRRPKAAAHVLVPSGAGVAQRAALPVGSEVRGTS
jgi:branched-subunit amino acid ABC-type transport system permease component